MSDTTDKAKDATRRGAVTGRASFQRSGEATAAKPAAGSVTVQVLKGASQTHRDALIRLKDR